MTKHLYRLILILAFSFNATQHANAEIYRWVDEQGNVHFGDSKHSNKQAENISGQLQHHNIDHSTKSTEATLQQIDRRKQAQQTETQQRQNQASPNKERRNRICLDAKERLRIMEGRVVFFDENNQPVKVTEEERQQRAETLSKQIKKYCS